MVLNMSIIVRFKNVELKLYNNVETIYVFVLSKACLSHHINYIYCFLYKRCSEVKGKETRTNPDKFYNFFCRTERFKRSPIVYATDKYNERLKCRS